MKHYTLWAVVLIIAGAGLIHDPEWIGTGYLDTLKDGLASALFSAGAIGLVVDFFLRKQVQSEMTRLVGIEKSITQNSLAEVGQTSEIDWKAFCRSGSRFQILSFDAENWIKDNWPDLRERASRLAVYIDVYLPDLDAPYLHALSEHQREDPSDLKRRSERTVEQLEEKQARSTFLRAVQSSAGSTSVEAFCRQASRSPK